MGNKNSNSQRTGVSTFAIRTSQRTDQKLQKSFHFIDTKENFNFFFQRFKKYITRRTAVKIASVFFSGVNFLLALP